MTDLTISLADLHRLSITAPDLPLRQGYQLAAWIASIRADRIEVGNIAGDVEKIIIAMPSDALSAPAGTDEPQHDGTTEPEAEAVAEVEPEPEPGEEDLPDQGRADIAVPPAPPQRPVEARPAGRSILKPAAKHGAPFTDADDLLIYEMRLEGKSAEAIADALERTISACNARWYTRLKGTDIAALRQRVGRTARVAAPVPPRPPLTTLSARGRELAAQIIKLPGILSPADDLFLARSAIDGLAFDAIGKELDRPSATVEARWRALEAIDALAPASAKAPAGPRAELVAALSAIAGA